MKCLQSCNPKNKHKYDGKKCKAEEVIGLDDRKSMTRKHGKLSTHVGGTVISSPDQTSCDIMGN
jgi:hypothetical protein